MIDDFVKVVEALAKLVGAFAWPAVGVYLIWRFGSALRDFLSDMAEGSLKAFGVEASAKRRLVAAVATAEIAKAESPEHPPTDSAFWQDALTKTWQAAELLAKSIPINETEGKMVLWVDDHPENNVREREALEAIGVIVSTATSSDEAMLKLSAHSYDVVISDMARPEGPRAGYELLGRMREKKSKIPFIIYSSSNTDEQQREALESGAFASSNKVSELIGLVADAIRGGRSHSPKPSKYSSMIRLIKAYREQKLEG